jgi:hypothetical protein
MRSGHSQSDASFAVFGKRQSTPRGAFMNLDSPTALFSPGIQSSTIWRMSEQFTEYQERIMLKLRGIIGTNIERLLSYLVKSSRSES